MNVLVVGGAGYIGSHCVRLLSRRGYRPVVLDSLVFGHRRAVAPEVPFYYGDMKDQELVRKILRMEGIEAVMHFAAFAYVGESVTHPAKYYHNNFAATLNLLEVMVQEGVKRFIFSSTCATYGEPIRLPLTEDHPQFPINPYGQTKLDVENMLGNFSKAYGLSFAALRYFNAAGASPDGTIGEDHSPETHLIPLVMDAALGKRDGIKIFGTDYATPDGTCLRDYIHVDDLATAHINVIEKLNRPGVQYRCNLGVGKPYSVREVIETVRKVSGKPIRVVEEQRRAGDPAALYANNTLAVSELGWKIQYDTLESIVETAWRWHSTYPLGFKGMPR